MHGGSNDVATCPYDEDEGLSGAAQERENRRQVRIARRWAVARWRAARARAIPVAVDEPETTPVENLPMARVVGERLR